MSADQYLQTLGESRGGRYKRLLACVECSGNDSTFDRALGGNVVLSISPSGSFAKGTANRSGTDIALFISLSESTPETLK